MNQQNAALIAEKVSAKSHHMVSVHPSANDVGIVDDAFNHKLKELHAQNPNMPAQQLASQTVDQALQDPKVNGAADRISGGGYLAGQVKDGMAAAAKEQIAAGLIQSAPELAKASASGTAPQALDAEHNVASNMAAATGQPSTPAADQTQPASSSNTASSTEPSSSKTSPNRMLGDLIANAAGAFPGASALMPMLMAGIEAIESSIASNPNLHAAMANFMNSASGSIGQIAHVADHGAPLQTANLSAQSTSRSMV